MPYRSQFSTDWDDVFFCKMLPKPSSVKSNFELENKISDSSYFFIDYIMNRVFSIHIFGDLDGSKSTILIFKLVFIL